MINKLNIDEFKDKGFIVLKDYIKPNLLESLKKALFVMFFHSLKKSIKTDKLEELIYSLETEDHNKVYNIHTQYCREYEDLKIRIESEGVHDCD